MGRLEQTKAENSVVLNRNVERLIRQSPAQYLWSYRRYKTPAGVALPVVTEKSKAGMMYVLFALLWLLHWLPLPLLDVLGALLGEFLHLVIAPRRRITLINLQRAFPDITPQQRRSLAREHFRHMASALLSQSILWWGSKSGLLG